jgi:hypothetical protein
MRRASSPPHVIQKNPVPAVPFAVPDGYGRAPALPSSSRPRKLEATGEDQ